MEVLLDYYDYIDNRSKKVKVVEITADDEISIFEQFYKLNNSLRYCNGSYYKFIDKLWEDKYNLWLSSDDYKSKSFYLFYGNGTVD